MTMLNLHKKIVSDDLQQPVAVLIDYQDWLKIEQLLSLDTPSMVQKTFTLIAKFSFIIANS